MITYSKLSQVILQTLYFQPKTFSSQSDFPGMLHNTR